MSNGKIEMGMIGKILLIIVLLITILSGFNNLLIGLSSNSLVRLISPTSGITMRVIYTFMSMTTLVTAVWLFIKVFVKKE